MTDWPSFSGMPDSRVEAKIRFLYYFEPLISYPIYIYIILGTRWSSLFLRVLEVLKEGRKQEKYDVPRLTNRLAEAFAKINAYSEPTSRELRDDVSESYFR